MAQEVLREMRGLERRIETSDRLDEWRGELDTFGELLREGEPADADARTALEGARVFGDELELSVKMSAPEDSSNAWFSIHAGAGGTESQDWAEMLLRMYMRFVESRGWKARADRPSGRRGGGAEERDAPRGRRPRLRVPQG